MPLYEYECNKCHDRYEVIQKLDASPVHRCPQCGGKARRLISAPSFRFRGSGWYVTDYGKGKKASSEPGPEKEASGKKDHPGKGAKPSDKSSPDKTKKG